MRPSAIRDTLFLCALLTPTLISEANQKSHHGHISYNLQGLSHIHQRPPTNVTATVGLGVDLICKVVNIIMPALIVLR